MFRKFSPITILFIFFSLSILITFPLVINMTSKIYGEPGDVYDVVWNMWVHSFISKFEYSLNTFIPISSAPFGFVRSSIQPVTDFFIFFMGDLFGEIFAYNLLIILGFTLTSLSMYLLVYSFTKHHLASIFSGIVFGFSPYMVMHAIAGHLGFSFVSFLIPVYVLLLVRSRDSMNYKNMIFCGIAYAMITLSSIYNGYLMIFFTFYFICFESFRLFREKKFRIKIIGQWCLMFLIASGIVFVFERHVLFSSGGQASSFISIHRPFKELFIYSAKPWNYILPSPYNPFFGKFIKPFTDNLLMGSNYTEQTLYLGFAPLILACYIVVQMINPVRKNFSITANKKITDWKPTVTFFATAGVAMMIFSGPPFFPLGSFKIEGGEIIAKYKLYFPSYFLYKIAPMFRVYARFGVLVLFCVSILAAFGFIFLYERMKTNVKKIAFVVLAFMLLGIEFASVPKFIDIRYVPPVYKWLEEQKEDFIIVEYPLEHDVHGLPGEYKFFQRIHKKKLFNGTMPGTVADKIRFGILQPFTDSTVYNLKRFGIKYLIFHTDKYAKHKGSIPKVTRNLQIKFVRNFGATAVYSID